MMAGSGSSLEVEESQDGEGSAENGVENGVCGVNDSSSENLGSLVGGNGGGGGGVEDCEVNGVSSLVEMQKNGGEAGLDSMLGVIDGNEGEGASNGGDDGKKEGEGKEEIEIGGRLDDSDYDVGDFVWGKIKSHPWWPGRVYDPLDASEQAKRVKRGGDRILVAYFGDGTFAWCNSSQLKRFHENFVGMANQSSSRNFVNAVEKAVEEVGRMVELSLTCSCVRRDDLVGFGRSLAANAGVKDGLLVPEGGVGIDLFDPETVLHSVKYLSRVGTVDSLLEFVVLNNSLSSFYRAKGGIKLQDYNEPKGIPGLEDESGKRMFGDPSNQKDGLLEGAFSGPVEEDWVSSSLGHESQNSLQKSQVFPGRLTPRRTKQKSIAAIISLSLNAQTVAEASRNTEAPSEAGSKLGKQAIAESPIKGVCRQRKRKYREASESEVTAANHEGSVISEEVHVSKRRKKLEDISVVNADSHGRRAEEEASEMEMDGGLNVHSDDDKIRSTYENVALSRERKKSKYLSPPYTSITTGQWPKMKVSDETEAAGHHWAAVDEKPDYLAPETPKHQTSTVEAQAVKAAASEVLSHIRSVAIDPLRVEENEHLNQVLGFVSEFRSSGHDGEAFNDQQNVKPKRGRRKKSLQVASESDPSSRDDLKSRQDNESQKSDKPIAATLYVTFGPGSSLPTKVDLLRIYGPFGALNRYETDMLYNNRCARIVFSSIPGAEAALSHSQRSSPFGSNHVNFRLRFPTSTPNDAAKTASNPAAAEPSSELHQIISKLETTVSMLRSSSSEETMSSEFKSRVAGEIRGAIEMLNVMARPAGGSS